MKRYYLVGNGIKNSPSPYVHGQLFKLRGNTDATYTNADVDAGTLDALLNRIENDEATGGYNVTVPYKRAVLERHSAAVTESVSRYYSVNTVSFSPISLYNTDAEGFKKTNSLFNLKLNGNVAICGKGATGIMAGLAVAEAGGKLTYICDKTRPLDKESVTCEIHKVFPNYVVNFDTNDAAFDCDLLINATPLGNTNHPYSCPVGKEQIKRCSFVLDLNYYPQSTLLMRIARRHGVPAANGLTMLVHQAAAAQRVWLSEKFSDDELKTIINATRDYLDEAGTLKRNCIILCGFMGAGKSHLGKALADALAMDFYDTDALVENRFGSISGLFEEGEAKFRAAEREVIKGLKNSRDCVIALGGGAPLSADNRADLKKLGIVCFLDTPFDVCLSRIKKDLSRPLARETDDETLKNLYDSRKATYSSFADTVFTGDNLSDLLTKLSTL